MELPRNKIVTLFGSVVRAFSNNSDDQLNEHCRGLVATINMAAVPGTDTVTFSLDGKDPVNNLYYPILTSAALVAGETKSAGSVTLTGGAAGSINTVTVGGVNIISSAVPFNASLNQTATDLAAKINSSQSNYTAGAAGAVVTITAVAGTGTIPNGMIVSATLTTITATFVNMTGGVSGAVILRVYPGIVAAANLSVNDILPRSWRLRAVHSAGSNFTYSAVAQMIL